MGSKIFAESGLIFATINLMQGSEKKNLFLVLISSLLFGSSLSVILTKLLITQFNLNFLSLNMIGVTPILAYNKTFDLLDFALAGVFSFLFFVINFYGKSIVSHFRKNADFDFATTLLFIFSITVFIQTHFIIFSGTQAILLMVGFEIVYFALGIFGKNLNLSNLITELKTNTGKIKLQNGIFLGFILLLITNKLTTIPGLSVSFLVTIPLLLLAVSGKRLNKFLENFPGFLLLLAILFPTNLIQILILLVLTIVTGFVIQKFRPGLISKNWITLFLNPALIIFLIVYNPNFNIGNFDSIEEGFWLGWVQRLINGEVLYRDVAVYHTPFMVWGMYLTSLFTGFNIYSERLFLHLLQVLAVIIFFFFSRKVIGNTIFALLATTVFLGIASSLTGNKIDFLRNNFEIRLALPLLSLLVLFIYFQSKKTWQVLLSGILGVVAFLTSIESGLVVLITLFLSLNFFSDSGFSKLKFRENGVFFAGVLGSLGIFLGYLVFNGALSGFFDQIFFYSSAFSSGYFNLAMERSVPYAFFYFDMFDEYLDSVTIFWESTKLIFYGFLIFGIYKFFSGQKFSLENKYVLTTSFFGFVLTRAALGRSDWYHLVSILSVAVILLFFAFYKLYFSQKILTAVLIAFLLFVMIRPAVNNYFLSNTIFKFETYGRVTADYNAYYFDRGSGALLGLDKETKPTLELIEYIQQNSTKEDKIFVYPWSPEIYFYADRKNATKFDTPLAFFSDKYQNQMVEELKNNPPKFIISNEGMKVGDLTNGALPLVKEYIDINYQTEKSFGPLDLMVPKN